mgnify:CR=1 FL=1
MRIWISFVGLDSDLSNLMYDILLWFWNALILLFITTILFLFNNDNSVLFLFIIFHIVTKHESNVVGAFA